MASNRIIEAKTKEIEAKTKEIEAKTKEIEAKSKEIEAKCLSKAEIKELITEDCSKNPCENAKHPTKHVPRQNGSSRQTVRRAGNGRARQNGQSRQNSRPRQTAKTANGGFGQTRGRLTRGRARPHQTVKRAG